MIELIRNNPNTAAIPLILVTTFLAVIGQLSLKHGMTSIGHMSGFKILAKSIVKLATNPFLIIGLACYVFSTLLWMMILTKTPLSYCYPFISLSYVFVIFASRLIFRERIDHFKILAIIFIISGVILLSMSGSGGGSNGR